MSLRHTFLNRVPGQTVIGWKETLFLPFHNSPYPIPHYTMYPPLFKFVESIAGPIMLRTEDWCWRENTRNRFGANIQDQPETQTTAGFSHVAMFRETWGWKSEKLQAWNIGHPLQTIRAADNNMLQPFTGLQNRLNQTALYAVRVKVGAHFLLTTKFRDILPGKRVVVLGIRHMVDRNEYSGVGAIHLQCYQDCSNTTIWIQPHTFSVRAPDTSIQATLLSTVIMWLCN